jgi:small redox-active disulfide protein 2
MTNKQEDKTMIKLKVLGGGCPKCHALENNSQEAIKELNIDAEVELITDQSIITSYGIAMTPALVIDEEVVSAGKLLTKDKVIDILRSKNLA